MNGSPRRVSDWLYLKLARETSTGEYIPEIDGFRFASIVVVMLTHSTYQLLMYRSSVPLPGDYWEKFNSRLIHLLGQGHVGVLLFFTISGFVLGLPFARVWLSGRPKPSLRQYFLRRLTRIEPPYIFNITVCFLFLYGFAGWQFRLHSYLASLSYLHNILYGKFSSINIVAWSLEIEIQFYILAPLLAYVFAVKSPFWRRLVLLVAMAAFGRLANVQTLPLGPAFLRYTLVSYLQFFLGGFLLADLYETGAIRRRGSLAWDAIGLASALALVYGIGWHWWTTYWTLSFLVLLMWVGGFQGLIANWLFTRRLVTTIGGMCYSLYLWHSPLLVWSKGLIAVPVPRGWPIDAQVILANVITLPILVAAGAIIFYLTEKPFMGNRIPRWITTQWNAVGSLSAPAPAGQP